MSKRTSVLMAAVVSVAGSAAMAAPSLTGLDGALDSSLFAGKYEGNVLPQNAGLGFVLNDPNARFGTADDPASLGTSGGVDYLQIDSDTNDPGGDNYYYTLPGGGTWNPDDSALGGFTMEIRAIVRPTNSGSLGFAVQMVDQNSNGLTQFFNDKIIGPNDSAAVGAVPTASNSDTWHTFRIASYSPGDPPNSANQIFHVWRDGVEIGQLANNVNFLGEFLRFGDVFGAEEVNVDIDYLRWTTDGAYSPAPIPEPTAFTGLVAAGAGMMLRRRNRSAR